MKNIIVLILVMAACDTSKEPISNTNLISISRLDVRHILDNRDALATIATRSLAENNDITNTDSGRVLFSELVACALPSDVSLTVNGTEFFGEIGLSSKWEKHPLHEKGKSWISACVFSKISGTNVAIPISLRGPNKALHADVDEKTAWSVEEGAFFGDMFVAANHPINWFACRGRGPISADRICAEEDPLNPGLTKCGFAFIGNCVDECELSPRNFYSHCNVFTQSFQQIVTIYLQP